MSDEPEAPRAPDEGAARRQKFVLKWLIFGCLVVNLLVLLWAFLGKRS